MGRNKIIVLVLVFGLAINSLAWGQDIVDSDYENTTNTQDRIELISQIRNNLISEAAPINSIQNNSVYIEQVGKDNTIFSNIKSQSSNLKLTQKGNSNLIEINEFSNQINKEIVQLGDNNTVTDFSFNPDINTNLELIQEGNNLTFERFGTNDISKNLKFKMTGELKTIIVRSF